MSQEALVDFFQTLEKDEALKERFTAIDEPAEVARLAQSELGYNFTAEELTSALATIDNSERKLETDELDERQLESVAGGRIMTFGFGCGSMIRLGSIRLGSGW